MKTKWLLVISAALPLNGCFDVSSGTCGNSIVQTVPSPNFKFKAVIFERNCGDTTRFSTHVSILPAHASLGAEGGNTFVSEAKPGAALSGPGGGPKVWVKWLGANKLKIGCDLQANNYQVSPQFHGVSVVCQGK